MSTARYRVYICVGPNCGPKGSAKLAGALARELEDLGINESQVSVTMGGCQSHCETGPTMVVYPGPVFYERVDRERLRKIAVNHLLNNEPVTEYFWDTNRMPRKIVPARTFSKGFDPGAAFKPDEDRARKPRPRKVYEVDDFKW